MGWEIGSFGDRDIGYGVPAVCDHPACNAEIDRGLSYVCGSDPYGGEHGCGLFFCEKHRNYKEVENKRTIRVPGEEKIYINLCARCYYGKPSFEPKPDVTKWINHKLTHESWAEWRNENTEEVESLKTVLRNQTVKILPMWQPYASLAVLGEKENETRSWDTRYRGVVAIYATKNFPPSAKSLAYDNLFCREALSRHFIEQLPYAGIIGSVELVETEKTDSFLSKISEKERAFGDYSPGRFVWLFSNPVELKEPIPFKGQQGMWNAPDEIRNAILQSRGIQ
ncbi:MAG TPA: hypothetical protein VF648_00460 [Pyrinomonadaceae bacterium]|jgi:hypothetical protein